MNKSIIIRRLIYNQILIISILILGGCSVSKGNSGTPTDKPKTVTSSKPSVTKQPSITENPTDALPASPSTATTPTKLPSPTQIAASQVANPLDRNTNALKALLKKMTLEEKVGQMFFVRCNKDTALEDIPKYHLGGFILFADQFKNQTKKTIKSTVQSYQKASDIPMLIGVDEEGGTVNRISSFKAFRAVPFKSPQELYKLGGYKLIKSDTLEKSILLKSLGININLAPICDVSTNAKDFIYQRSFGKDAKATSSYVKTVVTVMNREKIGCTLKHFPGYGNNVDTHNGIAIDTRSSSQFYKVDFLPFQAGISTGAGSILISHNIVKAFDTKHPASLSVKIHNLLRNVLKFKGVIMTDDLSMEAIKKYTGEKNAAVSAVLAGNDLLIASDYNIQIPAVISAVKKKNISVKQIDDSVLRILRWKLSLGILKL